MGVQKLEEAEAPFPSKMGSVCLSSQHCVGLLIDNWIKSEPASVQGYLLLLRGEIYLELFLSYLIFGACVGSELWKCLDAPASPLRGVKHLPGKGSPVLALRRLWQEPPCSIADVSILLCFPSRTTELFASVTVYHPPWGRWHGVRCTMEDAPWSC